MGFIVSLSGAGFGLRREGILHAVGQLIEPRIGLKEQMKVEEIVRLERWPTSGLAKLGW